MAIPCPPGEYRRRLEGIVRFDEFVRVGLASHVAYWKVNMPNVHPPALETDERECQHSTEVFARGLSC